MLRGLIVVQIPTGCIPADRGAGCEELDAQQRRRSRLDQGLAVLRGSKDWRSGLGRSWLERILRVSPPLLQKC